MRLPGKLVRFLGTEFLRTEFLISSLSRDMNRYYSVTSLTKVPSYWLRVRRSRAIAAMGFYVKASETPEIRNIASTPKP